MKVNVVSFRRVTGYLAVVAALAIAAAAQTAPPPAASSGGLDEAKRLVDGGNYADAITALEKIAASSDASAPQALKMMGDCYKALQKWGKAIECFEKLTVAYPNSVAPNKEIKSWIMDCYLANSESDKALALRKELLAQYGPDAWKVYYIVGWRYAWLKKFAEAESELERAVEAGRVARTDEDMFGANRLLLVCYVVRAQWDKAEKLAQRLLRDYPDKSYEWNYQIGKSYQARQEYAKAIEILEPAAKLAPDKTVISRNIYKTMLDCYDETGRLDKAIPLAEKLVGDYPRDPAWQWRLGWYCLSKQQYTKAEPLFAEVIQSSKADWEIRKALIFRGQCLYALGRGPDALEMVETYFKDKSAQWDDHLLIKAGVLYYGPRDDAGCVEALRELLAQVHAGKNSILVSAATELLYKALVRNGDQLQAAVEAEKMGMAAKDWTWLIAAGNAYYKAAKYTEAKRVYKGVADDGNAPDWAHAAGMQGMATCYWQTGMKDAARRLALRVKTEYSGTMAGTDATNSLNEWSLIK